VDDGDLAVGVAVRVGVGVGAARTITRPAISGWKSQTNAYSSAAAKVQVAVQGALAGRSGSAGSQPAGSGPVKATLWRSVPSG